MLQILPVITTSVFAICKKLRRRLPGTPADFFSIFAEYSFLNFYSFEHKQPFPQNVVSTPNSSTPHMVNFWVVLKETRPLYFSRRLFYFITAWILLIRFAARLVSSENLIVFLLEN